MCTLSCSCVSLICSESLCSVSSVISLLCRSRAAARAWSHFTCHSCSRSACSWDSYTHGHKSKTTNLKNIYWVSTALYTQLLLGTGKESCHEFSIDLFLSSCENTFTCSAVAWSVLVLALRNWLLRLSNSCWPALLTSSSSSSQRCLSNCHFLFLSERVWITQFNAQDEDSIICCFPLTHAHTARSVNYSLVPDYLSLFSSPVALPPCCWVCAPVPFVSVFPSCIDSALSLLSPSALKHTDTDTYIKL